MPPDAPSLPLAPYPLAPYPLAPHSLALPTCHRWLREAGGLAESETAAAAASKATKEAEAATRQAELQARTAELIEQLEARSSELDQVQGAQRAAASTVAELRDRCEALDQERSTLAMEKGELVAELARHAGHLNHKQKIHYVAKLKHENDELKQQLKETLARTAGAPAAAPLAGKENGPTGPPPPPLAAKQPAAPAGGLRDKGGVARVPSKLALASKPAQAANALPSKSAHATKPPMAPKAPSAAKSATAKAA